MTVHLVVNPTAGGGRAGKQLPSVVAQVRRTFAQQPVRVHRATSVEHARQCLRDAIDTRHDDDVLIVMGGDGMMHLGLNTVAGTEIGLGMIPAGSGDDLCRGLGIPVGDTEAALDLLAGEPRPVDLMQVGQHWVGSIVASGFDARVNLRANRMRFPRGRLQYPVAVAAELATFRPLQYRLTIDGGQVREFEAMLVAVGNTTSFGGGLKICPEAEPDDGLLDLTIIHPVSRRTLVGIFPKIYSGSFTHLDVVEQLRCREVVLDGALPDDGSTTPTPLTVMGDGEELGPTSRTITCRPGALRVFAPLSTPG